MRVSCKSFFFFLIPILLFSGCALSETEPKIVKPKPKPIIKKIVEPKVIIEEVKEVDPDLTPLQMCEKVENKFNLIVNAPEDSTIRILNIKPKYHDCISLKESRYLIEVSKKGYMQHKEWIRLDEDMEVYVSLIEYLNGYAPKKVTDLSVFNSAGYNENKLKKFIKKYPKSAKIKDAKGRLYLIENTFMGYSPKRKISYSGCSGFYPKRLSQEMLTKGVKYSKWDTIRWAGSCKDKLFDGRGTIYLNIKNTLHVELKGKMKNGFFEGNVYNHSSAKRNPSLIKGDGSGKFNIKLDSQNDFKKYQN